MKCSFGISDFLEEISSFPFRCFPLFICIDHLERLSHLSLLFFGTLYSDGYIFPFLLCLSLLFSALCKASSDNHFTFLRFFLLGMVLITASCTMSRTSIHSSITKVRLKLKKVGKTTRPFKYDLNQIPDNYTVQVRNRFKGLDLIECLKNYGWRSMTLYRMDVQIILKKKKCKKATWLSEEALQIAE